MDIDTGLYPFTDSFHTTTGAVCSGLGIPEDAIETQIGVFSAISVIRKGFLKRIQDFPTHIKEDESAFKSIKTRFANEYDLHPSDYAYGWTDLNLIKHAELINNLSSIMLTHLDVLNDLEKIKVATKYTVTDDKNEVFDRNLPANIDVWEKMVPSYTEVPGWKQSLDEVDD